jgi:death-on-curing protein
VKPVIYLDVEDLVRIADRVTGGTAQVRDMGLLGSSAHRPRTNVFGHEPYPTLADKAAALMVSLTMNHALIDGNKRLALGAGLTFIYINTGVYPDISEDEQYELVMGIAAGELELTDVADILRNAGV